jgi:hypothetical protein
MVREHGEFDLGYLYRFLGPDYSSRELYQCHSAVNNRWTWPNIIDKASSVYIQVEQHGLSGIWI